MEGQQEGVLAVQLLDSLGGPDNAPRPVADHDGQLLLLQDLLDKFAFGDDCFLALLFRQVRDQQAQGLWGPVQVHYFKG